MFFSLIVKFFATYLIFLLGIFAVFAALKYGNRFVRECAFIVTGVVFGYVLARFAGLFYFHEQPFLNDGFLPIINHGPNNAFPSDHMTTSSVLASYVFLKRKSLGLIAFILAILVGIGRILGGVHYFVDVLVGFGLGILAVMILKKISEALFKREEKTS